MQLTSATSSSKKRRLTRQSRREQDSNATSTDPLVLPSTEGDGEPTYSFSATSTSGFNTPAYVRGDSLSLVIPPHLQTHSSSLTATDYASSAASSPCAASADLPVEVAAGGDVESGAATSPPSSAHAKSRFSYLNTSYRALMEGNVDMTQRSSSPLKRRASSMDLVSETADGKEDVDMLNVNDKAQGEEREHSYSQEADGQDMDVAAGILDLPVRSENPPLEQQVQTIEKMVTDFAQMLPQDGDSAYLVSRQWLGKAQSLLGDSKHAPGAGRELFLGPIDNSDIIQTIFTDSLEQTCVKLKAGLTTEHFEVFPQKAWDLLMSWYGLAPGQVPIVRTAHNTAIDSNCVPNIRFEFHPPVFFFHRLWSAACPLPIDSGIKARKPPPPVMVKSSSSVYHKFLLDVKRLGGVDRERKIRLWRLIHTIPTSEESNQMTGMKTPPDSPGRDIGISSGPPYPLGSWPEMLVDVDTFRRLEQGVERVLVEADDSTVNANYNGKKSLGLVGLTVDQVLVIEESIDRDLYVTTYNSTAFTDKSPAVSSLAGTGRATASGRNSPLSQGPMTRGRPLRSGRAIGVVGLHNLGNTCYMNSALQCVRSVEELTKYFLTHEDEKELNVDNPLSHNGEVAHAYGRLLREVYKDPPPNSLTPKYFKNTVGRHVSAFSGNTQQDSQEFVGFLLDGLQEDLNRIKKKPYIAKPDSTDEMINNPAAIREMAAKVWDITRKRDDSVIADLFTGLYKSTLICPECDKISITFDPFNNLTLPLPVTSAWIGKVKYFPLNDAPVQMVVDIDKTSTFKALKQFLSERVGVPVERLVASEEFKRKFYKHYDDAFCVYDEIGKNDDVVVHELEAAPTNLKCAKTARKQTGRSLSGESEEAEASANHRLAERLLVPVLHRRKPENRFRRNTSDSDALPPPHFIVLTHEEARSEDIIRRKVLEKMATYSTWSEFSATGESGTAETEPEMLNNTSDADSLMGCKVVAHSVEGEDDMVDVTMAEANDSKPSHGRRTKGPASLIKQFNTRRPRWIKPDEFLNPALQNLFEMGYFTDKIENMIPTGWQNPTDDVSLPKLCTRQPVLSDVEMRSPGAGNSVESGSEGSPTSSVSPVTRMADESDSDSFPSMNSRTSKGRKSSKAVKKYGRSSKKRLGQTVRDAREPQLEHDDEGLDALTSDGGPLVRLNEGLVVDWSDSALETVFGLSSVIEPHGSRTYMDVPTLEDPVVKARQLQRKMRETKGITLDDCLDEFEKEEVLSEQDMWYCPRCKAHRRATKKFDLWKTPDILVVHLKRFSSTGYRREKIEVMVHCPIESLNLARRVVDQQENREEVYDLIAVDDHWGGLGGGHYTAFAKNFIDGEWYEYNVVNKVENCSRVISPAAYLLFYRRRSQSALGGPRYQDILERYESQLDSDSLSGSGEGRRLGTGSSPRGSPSALAGAGLILPQGSPDEGSTEAEDVPGYAEMGPWPRGGVRNSIEGDEGVGLEDHDVPAYQNVNTATVVGQTWKWPKAGEDVDLASDVAQGDGNSSVVGAFGDEDEDDDRTSDPPHRSDLDHGQSQTVPTPIVGQTDDMRTIAMQLWDNKIHNVPVDIRAEESVSDVAEIHVEEDHEKTS